jgi:hypothetical protein
MLIDRVKLRLSSTRLHTNRSTTTNATQAKTWHQGDNSKVKQCHEIARPPDRFLKRSNDNKMRIFPKKVTPQPEPYRRSMLARQFNFEHLTSASPSPLQQTYLHHSTFDSRASSIANVTESITLTCLTSKRA